MHNLRHAASKPKKLHQRHAILLLNLVRRNAVVARSESEAVNLGQTNRPATIKTAATTPAARVTGHTDGQLLDRNGAVDEMRTDMRAE
jgi:hypothetical protein